MTKLPPNASMRSAGCSSTMSAAPTRMIMARMSMASTILSPRKTPSIRSASAPPSSTSSGTMGANAVRSIGSSLRQCRDLGGGERRLGMLHQEARRGRAQVEDRARPYAKQDGQHHQWRQDHDLPGVQVLDRLQVRLFQHAEDHTPI